LRAKLLSGYAQLRHYLRALGRDEALGDIQESARVEPIEERSKKEKRLHCQNYNYQETANEDRVEGLDSFFLNTF